MTTPYRFVVRPRRDRLIGPVAFSGLRNYTRPEVWRSVIEQRAWFKSVALVSPGARATLVVPPEQRAWMKLVYGGRHAVTLVGCRRFTSPAARKAECGPGDQSTCQRDRTPFTGGFDIDTTTPRTKGAARS